MGRLQGAVVVWVHTMSILQVDLQAEVRTGHDVTARKLLQTLTNTTNPDPAAAGELCRLADDLTSSLSDWALLHDAWMAANLNAMARLTHCTTKSGWQDD